MMTLLVLRARLRSIYQKFEIYMNPIIKFIIALVIFQIINNLIGYDDRLKQLPITLALSLLCAFTPSAILVLLSAIVSVAHIYSISSILALIILLIYVIMYSLFLRFTPRFGYVVLAIPILFFFKIPYLIPILLGLFATPITIIPASCGVIIYFLFGVIEQAAAMQVNVTLEDTLQLYTYVADSLIGNQQLYMTMIIFSLIIIITYLVWHMKFDYAHELAVAAGALTTIIGFLFSDLRLDISEQIGSMIFGTIISALIPFGIQFFHLSLDYTGVEHVQFEDDDYYYYVKAVPKINVTTPQVNVKRFNTQKNPSLTGKIGKNLLLDEEDLEEDEYEGPNDYGTNNKNDVK